METNVFFSAVQSALDAHIKRMVEEAVTPLLERITALENNPAQGVDTTLTDRVVALETKLTEAALFERNINVQTLITPETVVNSMNNAEWLWEKVNAYIETGIEDRIERAIDDHCETYNHDDYDNVYNEWGGEEASDFVKEGDLGETVREHVEEAFNNATFSVSVSI